MGEDTNTVSGISHFGARTTRVTDPPAARRTSGPVSRSRAARRRGR